MTSPGHVWPASHHCCALFALEGVHLALLGGWEQQKGETASLPWISHDLPTCLLFLGWFYK